jgi:hypothetical protein
MKSRAASEKCKAALIVLLETDKGLDGIEQVLRSAVAGGSCMSPDLDEDLNVARF